MLSYRGYRKKEREKLVKMSLSWSSLFEYHEREEMRKKVKKAIIRSNRKSQHLWSTSSSKFSFISSQESSKVFMLIIAFYLLNLVQISVQWPQNDSIPSSGKFKVKFKA